MPPKEENYYVFVYPTVWKFSSSSFHYFSSISHHRTWILCYLKIKKGPSAAVFFLLTVSHRNWWINTRDDEKFTAFFLLTYRHFGIQYNVCTHSKQSVTWVNTKTIQKVTNVRIFSDRPQPPKVTIDLLFELLIFRFHTYQTSAFGIYGLSRFAFIKKTEKNKETKKKKKWKKEWKKN